MKKEMLLVLLAVFGFRTAWMTTISATDERISYMGRVDFSKPEAPAMTWVMTGVAVTLSKSSSISALFLHPKDSTRLRVMVDGKLAGFVMLPGHPSDSVPKWDGSMLDAPEGCENMKPYTLASNLTIDDTHTVQVYKVTEDNSGHDADGVLRFGGFILDKGGELGAKPPSAQRRIEVIGDSDTCGWCADGTPSGDGDFKYEDAYVTYAQQIARSVGADTMVEAISGYGVTKSSEGRIQSKLDNTLGFDKEAGTWNYTQWIPDAVMMLIGPNDFNYEDGQGFVDDYLQLMDMVAANYDHAPTPPKIVHVCGGSMNGFDACSGIQQANDRFNKKSLKIQGFYTTITRAHWNEINADDSPYLGCEGHYSERGHAVIAGDILPQFKQVMGWNEADSATHDLVV